MGRRLFVYGTLAPGCEPAHLRDVTARMVPLGPATVPGELFDLGLHPAALLPELATPLGWQSARVVGQVFDLPDDDTIWGRLDDYEGVDPLRPAAGLFRRERCIAQLDGGGEVACEIYVFNGRPPADRRVPDGRWRPPKDGPSRLPLRHRRDPAEQGEWNT